MTNLEIVLAETNADRQLNRPAYSSGFEINMSEGGIGENLANHDLWHTGLSQPMSLSWTWPQNAQYVSCLEHCDGYSYNHVGTELSSNGGSRGDNSTPMDTPSHTRTKPSALGVSSSQSPALGLRQFRMKLD